MAFADDTPLVPAATFAPRRFLFRRIVLISKEAVMSSRHIVFSCAMMALMVVAGSWYAVRAFPLTQAAGIQAVQDEPAPTKRRVKPITPENPIPRRVFSVTPLYPAEALASGARGTVRMRIVVDELGHVAEVTHPGASLSINGPTDSPKVSRQPLDAFREAATDAVRQWLYEPPVNGPIALHVGFGFNPDSETQLLSHRGASDALAGARARWLRATDEDRNDPPAIARRLKRVVRIITRANARLTAIRDGISAPVPDDGRPPVLLQLGQVDTQAALAVQLAKEVRAKVTGDPTGGGGASEDDDSVADDETKPLQNRLASIARRLLKIDARVAKVLGKVGPPSGTIDPAIRGEIKNIETNAKRIAERAKPYNATTPPPPTDSPP